MRLAHSRSAASRIGVAVLATWAVACGVEFEASQSTGAATTLVGTGTGAASSGGSGAAGGTMATGGAGGSGGTGPGTGAGTGTGASGGGPSLLDDTQLFARYWIDEAASGPAIGVLNDAASHTPTNLPLVDGGTTVWVEPAPGQRGLLFDNNAIGGKADVPVLSSKYVELHGRTQLTIEVVTSLAGQPTQHGRLFHLGDNSSWSSIQISQPTAGLIHLGFNDFGRDQWTIAQGERIVLHLVIDTTNATPSDRSRLYRNGVFVAPTVDAPLNLNEQLLEEPDPLPDDFIIGNVNGNDRSWDGVIHYLAIYTDVFTPQRISAHSAILLVSDDP